MLSNEGTMANFKRTKTKRNVRCTLCTKYRWKGNGKDRVKPRTMREKTAVEHQLWEFDVK